MPRNSRQRRSKDQELKARLKEQQRQDNYFDQLRRAQARERDRILLQTIKRSSKVGLYNPKELKLTKYRRYRANKIAKEYGDFLDPKKFFFVKAPTKAKKQVFQRAENLQIKHTRTGLLVPKEGHTRARLKTDRKRKEYYVERSGKTKRGPTKGVRYRTITPLASIDELDNERDRIRNLAKALGPLGRNDRITFKIIENGLEGYSHSTFSNVELLINYLEFYRKSIAAKVNFFRHIVLEKTTASQWFAEHPATAAGKKGRRNRDDVRGKRKLIPINRTKNKAGGFRPRFVFE